jgi:hypothetical protein
MANAIHVVGGSNRMVRQDEKSKSDHHSQSAIGEQGEDSGCSPGNFD